MSRSFLTSPFNHDKETKEDYGTYSREMEYDMWYVIDEVCRRVYVKTTVICDIGVMMTEVTKEDLPTKQEMQRSYIYK